ncbi:MAG: type II secretion system F family protein [Kiritimatiellae bacterium]|nr:type II secretion system F family protein [Kiritimatiellia bacterium]
MAHFKFTALDAKGKEVSGEIDAADKNQALDHIKARQLFPTKVEAAEVGGSAKTAKKTSALNMELKMPKWLQGGVKPAVLVAFTRQLATLVNAGLPLMRAIRVLQRQERNPALKDALGEMAESVEGGSTFAEALAAHPKIFDKLYVNMVRAGEVGGVLDVVLARLAEFQEKAQKIKAKVKSAMTYPIVVLVVAVGILVALMVFIVPKFQTIFSDMEVKMPAITQTVMDISNFMINHILVIIGIIIGIVIVFKLIGKSKAGRYAYDALALKAPAFGSLVTKNAISRFTRTLGTLMHAGVPVLQALNIVKETVGNEVVSKGVASVHDAVKEGENMAPPMASTKIFPPMVVSMVEVGEETGALPDMLTKIADSYDEDIDNAVASITSVIEPMLIIFLAVIVGTIVIALFMPLLSIMGNISG